MQRRAAGIGPAGLTGLTGLEAVRHSAGVDRGIKDVVVAPAGSKSPMCRMPLGSDPGPGECGTTARLARLLEHLQMGGSRASRTGGQRSWRIRGPCYAGGWGRARPRSADGAFSNAAALLRLTGAVLVDVCDEWQLTVERHNLSEHSMELVTGARNHRPGGGAKPELMTHAATDLCVVEDSTMAPGDVTGHHRRPRRPGAAEPAASLGSTSTGTSWSVGSQSIFTIGRSAVSSK